MVDEFFQQESRNEDEEDLSGQEKPLSEVLTRCDRCFSSTSVQLNSVISRFKYLTQLNCQANLEEPLSLSVLHVNLRIDDGIESLTSEAT